MIPSILLISILTTFSLSSLGNFQNHDKKNNLKSIESYSIDHDFPINLLLTVQDLSLLIKNTEIYSSSKNKEKNRPGDLNFLNKNHQLLLSVFIIKIEQEDKKLLREELIRKDFYELRGYGEMAYENNLKISSSKTAEFIFFKKNAAFILISYYNQDFQKTFLSLEDLKQISLIILSRIK